ncbi:MAG: hypothetical protein WA418_32640 [Bradyrhizobium sp.]
MPRIAQAASRTRALGRPKPTLSAVTDQITVKAKTRDVTLPLKLYQPAHQRYYLLTASLVCKVAGLPDRAVTRGGVEQIAFVVRRLLPPTPKGDPDSPLEEFAFIKDAEGPRWRRVAAGNDAGQLAPGEELLPLFPLGFRDGAQHARTLWTGLIPVGRREEYLGAGVDRTVVALTQGQLQSFQAAPPATPTNSKMARMTQFKLEVAEPWKNLIRSSYAASAAMTDQAPDVGNETPTAKRARAFTLNLQWQMQSWLILLDFADYLAAYLPDVWAAIEAGGGTLSPSRQRLFDWLGTAKMSAGLVDGMRKHAGDPDIKTPSPSLRDALKAIRTQTTRDWLEQTDQLYTESNANAAGRHWPGFHFLLAGLDGQQKVDGPFTAVGTLGTPTADEVQRGPNPMPAPNPALTLGRPDAEELDKLTALAARALDATPEADAPPLPFALQLRDALAATTNDRGWFVARCVHLNRDCGPLHPPVLSAATQRFQLSNFFDSDAPARPIRITLPTDTTPAGLRKHSKNTAFVISDVLCGQIQRAKSLGLGDLVRSVLPWPLHKDLDVGDGGACTNGGGINIGMICSLSIPIITICALILLIIIVTLFDFIFRWLPYFILCFPVPGLRGKK